MVAVCLIAAAGSATTTDQGNRFVQTILVANKASFHPQMVNPDMINPWGIAVRPPGAGGHFWINNAGTGTSVEYIGDVSSSTTRRQRAFPTRPTACSAASP
jgi:hypothetical protein